MLKACYVFFSLVLGIAPAMAYAAAPTTQPDLDPDALAILKAAVGSITAAKAYSYRVLVSRDREATDNQLITYFNYDSVTVARPNKIRIDVDGEHHDVQFFFDGYKATIYDPATKLYASQPAPSTIDGMLQAVEKRGLSLPMSNLLESDPYTSLTNALQTAYVVGRVNINNKTFIHLVFTEASADWQLWVTQGDKPLPRAMTIIYKTQPGAPRLSMDFSDWNLDAQPQADMFTFVKPDDAHQIEFFPSKAGK